LQQILPVNKLIFSLLFFLISIISFSQTKAKVIGVFDGDTITVLLSDKSKLKLRLAEVDCPEKGQAFAKNARQFTSDQIFGKQIIFFKTDKDRYGRDIAKIYYNNGKYLSEELIKNGLGWWYFSYSKNKYLATLEMEARSKKRGLWQDKKAVSPWEYRKIQRSNAEKKRLSKKQSLHLL